MTFTYMTVWSIFMGTGLTILRARRLSGIFVIGLATAFVLIGSQMLFVQLSLGAGIDPAMSSIDPSIYLSGGLSGWLALMVLPCGWLGPIVGLHLTEIMSKAREI